MTSDKDFENGSKEKRTALSSQDSLMCGGGSRSAEPPCIKSIMNSNDPVRDLVPVYCDSPLHYSKIMCYLRKNKLMPHIVLRLHEQVVNRARKIKQSAYRQHIQRNMIAVSQVMMQKCMKPTVIILKKLLADLASSGNAMDKNHPQKLALQKVCSQFLLWLNAIVQSHAIPQKTAANDELGTDSISADAETSDSEQPAASMMLQSQMPHSNPHNDLKNCADSPGNISAHNPLSESPTDSRRASPEWIASQCTEIVGHEYDSTTDDQPFALLFGQLFGSYDLIPWLEKFTEAIKSMHKEDFEAIVTHVGEILIDRIQKWIKLLPAVKYLVRDMPDEALVILQHMTALGKLFSRFLTALQNLCEAMILYLAALVRENNKEAPKASRTHHVQNRSLSCSIDEESESKPPPKEFDNPNKEKVHLALSNMFRCTIDFEHTAHDKSMMQRIMKETPQGIFNDTLDCLYPYVKDRVILTAMIFKRFGAAVLSNDKDHLSMLSEEKREQFQRLKKDKKDNKKFHLLEWTIEALRTIYRVNLVMPQQEIKDTSALVNVPNTAPMINGNTYISTGVISIEIPAFCEWADTSAEHGVYTHYWPPEGQTFEPRDLDFTIAHEYGHIADERNSWSLSEEMSKLSHWESTENTSEKIVKEMIDSMNGTMYDGELKTEPQIRVAVLSAQRYLDTYNNAEKLDWNDVKKYINDIFSNNPNRLFPNVFLTPKEAKQLQKVMLEENIEYNLLYYLWQNQHFNHPYKIVNANRSFMKKPFYQAYDTYLWYTFNIDIWKDYFSIYQFRSPREEFAEIYASYYVAPVFGRAKGELTPEPWKSWMDEYDRKNINPPQEQILCRNSQKEREHKKGTKHEYKNNVHRGTQKPSPNKPS